MLEDKQIIIDGVDVADCEHINACDKKMKCVILQDDICETNPYCEGFNCYYKQLKRKEQECSFNTLKIIALQEALEQYEIENDQLKCKEQIIEKLKEKHNAMCKSCPRNISCDECSNNTTLKILNGEIV